MEINVERMDDRLPTGAIQYRCWEERMNKTIKKASRSVVWGNTRERERERERERVRACVCGRVCVRARACTYVCVRACVHARTCVHACTCTKLNILTQF